MLCPCSRNSTFLKLSIDMGFSVKRSGNFLHRDLSMKKDSHCLKPFSSEQCFAKVLPHPFFLCVHILGYSIIVCASFLFLSRGAISERQIYAASSFARRTTRSPRTAKISPQLLRMILYPRRSQRWIRSLISTGSMRILLSSFIRQTKNAPVGALIADARSSIYAARAYSSRCFNFGIENGPQHQEPVLLVAVYLYFCSNLSFGGKSSFLKRSPPI